MKKLLLLALVLFATPLYGQNIEGAVGWGLMRDYDKAPYITYDLHLATYSDTWLFVVGADHMRGPHKNRGKYRYIRAYPGHPMAECVLRETGEEVSMANCMRTTRAWDFNVVLARSFSGPLYLGVGAHWNTVSRRFTPIGRVALRSYAFDGRLSVGFNLDLGASPLYLNAGYVFGWRF
jgi:hypothetical protein